LTAPRARRATGALRPRRSASSGHRPDKAEVDGICLLTLWPANPAPSCSGSRPSAPTFLSL